MDFSADGGSLISLAYGLAVPHGQLFTKLLALKGRYRLRGRDGTSEYRDRFSRLQTHYATEMFRRGSEALDIRSQFLVKGLRDSHATGPMIVISNHQGTIDIVALYAFLNQELKATNSRWVMKEELRSTPWGWAAAEMKSAFISRSKTEVDADIESIRDCGKTAYEDGGLVLIFPEGTRFDGIPRPGAKFKRLLEPKFKGFNALCDTMPGANVLSITSQWDGGGLAPGSGRTVLDLADFKGRTLFMYGELIPRARIEMDRLVWLNGDWRKKEGLLGRGLPRIWQDLKRAA